MACFLLEAGQHFVSWSQRGGLQRSPSPNVDQIPGRAALMSEQCPAKSAGSASARMYGAAAASCQTTSWRGVHTLHVLCIKVFPVSIQYRWQCLSPVTIRELWRERALLPPAVLQLAEEGSKEHLCQNVCCGGPLHPGLLSMLRVIPHLHLCGALEAAGS